VEEVVSIADRTNDRAGGDRGGRCETLRSGGHQQWAATLQAQLPKAQAIRDRLKGR
jgi:hypothetical protein